MEFLKEFGALLSFILGTAVWMGLTVGAGVWFGWGFLGSEGMGVVLGITSGAVGLAAELAWLGRRA